MTRLGSAGLLLATLIAGGCAATAGDGTGSSEDSIHLGRPLDGGTDAAATTDGAPSDPSDGGAPDDDAAVHEADAAPPGPPGPTTTTFGAKLASIGLDVNNLPSLHDLPMGQKMKVMRTFNESMGVSCNSCHDVSDYAKPTKQKEVASEGWELISRTLTMADGGALYCDSCHHGKFEFLDHSAGFDGIAAWMQTNFVEQIKTKSGDPMACTTCHTNGPPGGATH